MISIETVVKTLLYAAVGAVLLVFNLWYLRSCFRVLTGTQRADIIAPFQIIGATEDDQLGRKLALLLQSRLAQIENEIEDAHALALSPRDQFASPDRVRPQDQSQQKPVNLPDEVFQALNIDVNVGEIKLGGIFSWVWERLRADRFIQVTVEFQPEKSIVGLAVGGGSRPQWFDLLPMSNEQVVTHLAYAIAHPYFADNVPETKSLSPTEFQTLILTLHELARLNRLIESGFTATGEYEPLVPKLDALVVRLPKWKELLYIAAETAENAKQYDKARVYYQQIELLVGNHEQPTVSPTAMPSSEADYLSSKIKEMSEELLHVANTLSPVALGDAQPIHDRIRALVGVNSSEVPTTGIRIGIVGPPPPASDQLENVISLDEANPVEQKADMSGSMSQYVLGIIQATRLTAANVTFLVAGSGLELPSATTADILRAIEKLILNDADIVVITYGPLPDKILAAVFEAYPEIIFVQSQYSREALAPVSSNSMRVSSVTITGTAASFVSAPDTFSLWAPGVGIPLDLASGTTTLSGNTYAAAIAAGIVAQVKARHVDISSERLIATLHETAKRQVSEGPLILNLQQALQKLGEEEP